MLTTGEEAVVAALDEKSGGLALVLLNDGAQEREWRIDFSRFTGKSPTASGWITEPGGKSRYQVIEKIALQGKQLQFRQPKKSVQTVVVRGVSQ